MGSIAELLQESRNVRLGTATVPCHRVNSIGKVGGRREPFVENVIDPEFDLRCDFVVSRWAEAAEQATDVPCEDGPAAFVISVVGHGCALMGSVASTRPNGRIQIGYRRGQRCFARCVVELGRSFEWCPKD